MARRPELLSAERALNDDVVVVEDKDSSRPLHLKPDGMLCHAMRVVFPLDIEAVALELEVAEPHDANALAMILLGVRNELGQGHAQRPRC